MNISAIMDDSANISFLKETAPNTPTQIQLEQLDYCGLIILSLGKH